jgi:hypothetical protein
MLSAIAALLALFVFGSPTFAARQDVLTQPSLVVIPATTTLGAVADTEVALTLAAEGAATAKVMLYVPRGYTANLAQAPGTKLGTVRVRETVGGTYPELSGRIIADDPAKYVSDPRAQACAPGTHAAVWVIQVGTFTVPMYVDPTPATEASLGAYSAQVCLASPDVPESAGGAPNGLRLIEADMDFKSTFTNPPTPDTSAWRAIVTPYVSGTSTPNPVGTDEVRALTFFPFTIGIKGHYDGKTHSAILTGWVSRVTAHPVGIVVSVVGCLVVRHRCGSYGGEHVKTRPGGTYSLHVKLPKAATVLFFASIDIESEACTEPPVTSAPCIGEATAPAYSRSVLVKARK